MSMLQPCLSGSMPSFPFKRTVLVCCASSQQSHVALVNGPLLDARVPERTEIRFGLPSKGRMASDTLDLLKVRIVFFFFFLRKFHCIEISYNFCFVCVKGLSIVCEASESTTIRCANSSGMRKRFVYFCELHL